MADYEDSVKEVNLQQHEDQKYNFSVQGLQELNYQVTLGDP
jgi:hypothetical protein